MTQTRSPMLTGKARVAAAEDCRELYEAGSSVRSVTDRTGRRWSKDGARWTCNGSRYIRWRVLVAEHGPVTEAAPTDEKAP